MFHGVIQWLIYLVYSFVEMFAFLFSGSAKPGLREKNTRETFRSGNYFLEIDPRNSYGGDIVMCSL